MIRDLARLTARRHDVLVIGGGIHGLAAAYDAAQRGLSVALVERGDFGSGSSFNHAKTVHGGLRSLQRGDLVKARFSVGERRALARIAPHLVAPLPFVIDTTRTLMRGRLAMQAGLWLDACVGFDRNAGLWPSLRLPAGRLISREACAAVFGGERPAHVTGGARWYDYHMAHTDRLTLAFALAADAHGAVLANYVEALAPRVSNGRVTGFAVRDRVTGQTLEVEARVVVNAAGAFTGRFMEAMGAPHDFPLLKAMNLVTGRPAGSTAIGAPTSDGRLLLIMPWQGRALVGTSHSDRLVEPHESDVAPAELSAFVSEVNSAFPDLALTDRDVTLVHRGVVPAERNRNGTLGLRGHHRVVDHARDGVDGAISMVGVKYTTARGVAQQAIDAACGKLGRSPACRTGTTPLPGGEMPSLESERREAVGSTREILTDAAAVHLVETHGTGWRQVAALCRERPELAAPITPASPAILAELVHAVRAEMALTLTDVVVRRTGLGVAGHPGQAAVRASLAMLARDLGWDAARQAEEVSGLARFYAPVIGNRE